MISYIHRFNTEQEFDAKYNGNDYHEPWVSAINNSGVNYNKTFAEYYNYLKTIPLTFELLTDGDLSILKWFTSNSSFAKTIEFKYNNNSWQSITSIQGSISSMYETGGTSFNLPTNAKTGDKISFRGNNQTYGDYRQITSNNDYYNKFSIGIGARDNTNNIASPEFVRNQISNKTTLRFKVYGNVMSLIDSANYKDLTSFNTSNNAIFKNLFVRLPIVDASELILPATTLNEYCYAFMFKQNSFLENSPLLPAPILVNGCYNNMYEGCLSLNNIKCKATGNIPYESSINTYTNSWVKDIKPNGNFIISSELPFWGFTPTGFNLNDWATGINGCPESWTKEYSL